MTFNTFGAVRTTVGKDTLKGLIINGLIEKEVVDRNGRLYASDSGLCELKGAISSNFNGTKTNSAEMQFFVESGKTTESVVLRGLDNSGSLLFSDYKTPDIGINLGGYVDGIVYLNDKIWVMEVKEVGNIPLSPNKTHEAQAMIYCAILGLPTLICYVDRKYSGFPKGLIQQTYELDDSYQNRFKFLNRAVKSHLYGKNKLYPQKPSYMLKSHCGWCDYKNMCWGDVSTPEKWVGKDFKLATPSQVIQIEKEANELTKQLLNKDVARNRLTGVLNHIEKNGRDNAKRVLTNQDWSCYYSVIDS